MLAGLVTQHNPNKGIGTRSIAKQPLLLFCQRIADSIVSQGNSSPGARQTQGFGDLSRTSLGLGKQGCILYKSVPDEEES